MGWARGALGSVTAPNEPILTDGDDQPSGQESEPREDQDEGENIEPWRIQRDEVVDEEGLRDREVVGNGTCLEHAMSLSMPNFA
jgi:hypothetical protein